MVITIYNADSGEILKTLIGEEADIKSKVGNGQLYIEGTFNARKYKIVDGQPVELVIEEELSNKVRSIREKELAKTDWTQVADAPVDQQAWQTYRQALRDIPQQAGFPDTIVWPDKP